MEQRIGRTTVDGREVAYALAGTGPFLVVPPGWVSHVELGWTLPPERRFYEALARSRTLVRYDEPGCGLSSRDADGGSLAKSIRVLEAVVNAVGAGTFDLFGTSMAGFTAIVWAATHGASVRKLVLYGTWFDGPAVAAAEVREHVLGLVRTRWGLGSDLLADILVADATRGVRDAFIRYQREAASAAVAAATLERAYAIDLSAYLTRVRAPTLVLHRDHDRAAPMAQGRSIAAAIPGARFHGLEGRTHIAWLGDADALVRAVQGFLAVPVTGVPAPPALTKRQREVAALVADGLSNRDIATRLRIDERSAEGHVERIRNRLGFRSRAQVAAWWAAFEN